MKNHFDQNLNVKDLILDRKPSVIVEAGIMLGENTKKIMSLQEEVQFTLYMIEDDLWMRTELRKDLLPYPESSYQFISGLSYDRLAAFKDESIDFLIIDTDHNYWTCLKELNAAHPKLTHGAIVCFHDTESYGRKGGMMDCYSCGDDYPREEIKKTLDKGIMDAIEDFIKEHQDYEIFRESKQSAGAVAIRKK